MIMDMSALFKAKQGCSGENRGDPSLWNDVSITDSPYLEVNNSQLSEDEQRAKRVLLAHELGND